MAEPTPLSKAEEHALLAMLFADYPDADSIVIVEMDYDLATVEVLRDKETPERFVVVIS